MKPEALPAGWTVLRVELRDEVAAGLEVVNEAGAYREWLVPADLATRHLLPASC